MNITGVACLRPWRFRRSRTDAADVDTPLTLVFSRQCNGNLYPYASEYEGR